MATLRLETVIEALPEVCFDLSRSIDLHAESMARSKEKAVAGVTTGLIGHNEEVTWEAKHFGRKWRVTSRVTTFDPPHRFVDEMTVPGPFAFFRHEHLFEPEDDGTRMVDVVDYRLRTSLGGPLTNPIAGWYLRRLLTVRNQLISSRARKR